MTSPLPSSIYDLNRNGVSVDNTDSVNNSANVYASPKKAPRTVAETPSVVIEETITVKPEEPKPVVIRYPANKVNKLKFWLWGAFAFFVPFIILITVLSLTKPPLVQTKNNLGQPTGQPDYFIIVGASVIVGILALLVYILVVFSRPDKFMIAE